MSTIVEERLTSFKELEQKVFKYVCELGCGITRAILMELTGEINCLLLDRQKVKAEFRRGEIASKKMLANISHDIKTSLTVILGYLEIMRLTGADDEMLKKVEAKAKQVVGLINQFFTLAKLEAGDTNITLSRINVNEICRESTLGFHEILTQKDFEVELSIPERAVYAQGEKDALQRILYNLLSNAVRYGSEGKYLGIFLCEEKNSVSIDVTDRGKGIQKEFADRIFERLYTMEDSRNREIQGNGLGLTIAKNLAVQLGGDLCVESIPGIRTTFTVRLRKKITKYAAKTTVMKMATNLWKPTEGTVELFGETLENPL